MLETPVWPWCKGSKTFLPLRRLFIADLFDHFNVRESVDETVLLFVVLVAIRFQFYDKIGLISFVLLDFL